MLQVGQTVELKVKGQDNRLNGDGTRINTFKGKVQMRCHYDPPNTIRLFTGNKNFPVSVIRLANIVEVSGKKFSFGSADTQEWKVAGSKGAMYTVTRTGSTYHCTCPGFGFRHHCKHVEFVQGK